MEDIKTRLQKALTEKGMTASDLSKKSGIGKGSISKYLKGTVTPKQSAVGEMARALRVSPSWLLGYDVPMDNIVGNDNIIAVFEKLSPKDRENLLNYAEYLLTKEDKP